MTDIKAPPAGHDTHDNAALDLAGKDFTFPVLGGTGGSGCDRYPQAVRPDWRLHL
jgi:hypothetical protein